jgi:hypothetical protein
MDTNAPVITLLGANPVYVEVGGTYTDAGVAVTDNSGSYDLDIDNPVDTSTLGTYTVTYTATDTSGNAITLTRTVIVQDTTDPVITLVGAANITLEVHGTYAEPGATVTDNYDTGLTATITGTVDEDVVGDYTLTYACTDSSGNDAIPLTRTVHVVDTTKPFITLNGEATITVEVHGNYTELGLDRLLAGGGRSR